MGFIPHRSQRYETAGDWFFPRGLGMQVHVSRELGGDAAFAVAIHEMVEAYLCNKVGITADMVDEFDMHFDGDDPGADPKAPYHKQHKAAIRVEKLLASILEMDWDDYQSLFSKLPKRDCRDT